jgi:hypothetical protein
MEAGHDTKNPRPDFAAILLTPGAAGQALPDSAVPSDDEIRKILVERIDAFHQGVGMVVGTAWYW